MKVYDCKGFYPYLERMNAIGREYNKKISEESEEEIQIKISLEDKQIEISPEEDEQIEKGYCVLSTKKNLDSFFVFDINEHNFPDASFREYLLKRFKRSVHKNGEVFSFDVRVVKEINCSGYGIKNMEGIELFPLLEYLDCSNNSIEELKLFNTALVCVDCSNNQINELDVSSCTKLKRLYCIKNNIKSLNLSQNSRLEEVNCVGNNLNQLVLDKQTSLNKLFCCSNAMLNSIDISQCSILCQNILGNSAEDIEKWENYSFENGIKGWTTVQGTKVLDTLSENIIPVFSFPGLMCDSKLELNYNQFEKVEAPEDYNIEEHSVDFPGHDIKYKIRTICVSDLLPLRRIELDDEGKKIKKEKNGNKEWDHIYFEINNEKEWNSVTKSLSDMDDTATFYQIRQVMIEEGNVCGEFDINEKCLIDKIIILDFGDLFRKMNSDKTDKTGESAENESSAKDKPEETMERLLKALFDNGITCKYKKSENDMDGVNKEIHFVPFDKNDSMARGSKVTFIDEKLLEKLNPRLNLGVKFNEMEVDLSKYYSRRGLYLSTAERVVDPSFILDSERVIVVDDEVVRKCIQGSKSPKPENLGEETEIVTEKNICDVLHIKELITADPISKNQEDVRIFKIPEETSKSTKLEINCYDGEGIISTEYAKCINDSCGFKDATSFQIRMPFSKGMLHCVNFKKMIRELFDIGEEIKEFYITDMFGIKRNMMKAEIIMPKSMFKGDKWLRRQAETEKIDVMDYYFSKFNEYKHALYVSNTNLIYGKSAYTKLNYQILNTLDLRPDEIKGLFQNHLNWINNPQYILEKPKPYDDIDNNSIVDEAEDNQDNQIDEIVSLGSLLKRNHTLSHQKKIQQFIQQVSDGYKKDLARGRIIVEGEVCLLSSDLLMFVIDLADNHRKWLEKQENNDENKKEIDRFIDIIDDIKNNKTIHKEQFFMPGNVVDIEQNEWYAVFRNPHLSRNEQCLLQAYYKGKKNRDESLYYKYFGHLKSVIMMSKGALDPLALGGADFDGDIVKIITNKFVRDAVIRGTYELDSDIDKENHYRRRLGLIKIPDGGDVILKPVPDIVSYEVIANTFSNSVGRISNVSVRMTKDDEKNLLFTHPALTILTGLEIDAAKSGKHPNLDKILNKFKPTSGQFDYVRDFLEIVKDNASNHNRFEYDCDYENNPDSFEWQVFDKWSNTYRTVTYVYDDTECAIYQLPKFYLNNLETKIALPEGEKKGNRYIYFDFQKDSDWRDLLINGDDILLSKVGAVLLAYTRLKDSYTKLSSMTNMQRSYMNYVKTIMKYQYDWDVVYQYRPEDLLIPFSKDDFDLKAAQEVVSEKDWPFIPDLDKRVEKLKKIVGEEESNTTDFLSNFAYQGYNLLLYLLKDREMETIKDRKLDKIGKAADSQGSVESMEKYSNAKWINEEYFRDTYSEFNKILKKNTQNRDTEWKENLYQKTARKIDVLLRGRSELDKLKIMYSMTGSKSPDSSSDFFWKYMNYKTIMEHLIDEGKKQLF